MALVKTPLHPFEFFRLTKAKEHVDLAPNTLRTYARQGLKLHRVGGAVFVSRTELGDFIRSRAADERLGRRSPSSAIIAETSTIPSAPSCGVAA